MAQLSSISFSVTDEQLSQIDALITQTGQSRSEWLQALVSDALNQVLPPPALSLEGNPPRSEGTASRTRLSSGSPLADAAPEPPVPPPLRENELNAVLNRFIEAEEPEKVLHGFIDDIDDEPDEVLYGFLAPNVSKLPPDGTPSSGSQRGSSALPPLSQSLYGAEDEPDEILYDFLDEAERPF